MLLYGIAFVFLALFILSLWYYHPLLQPTTFALYGLTSVVMALLLESNFTPVFIFRYFLYIISGFIIIFIPFILITIALIIIKRLTHSPRQSPVRMVFSIIIAVTFILFVGLTFWGLYRWIEIEVQEIVWLYMMLALYVTANFFCYIAVNFLIDIWSRTRQSRILVVLGSQLDDINNVTHILRSRLDKAIKVYLRQKERSQQQVCIIVTGGPQSDSHFSEAEGMRRYLLQQGISDEDVILEPQAQNTYENFTNVKDLMNKLNLKGEVVVITSRFHLLRSAYVARQTDFKSHFEGANTPTYLWPYSIVREFLAYIVLTREINFLFIVLLISESLFSILF